MRTTELLRRSGMWVETAMAGSLPPSVRRVMHIELSMSLAYGVFYASIIPFTPVVLRRLGASVDMLAVYTSLAFVGSVFTSFSVVLMRRRRTINLIVFCWLLGRSLFLLTAVISGAIPLMVIAILLWVLEEFVIPAYTRVVQKIYPVSGRGKVMSTVRMGMVSVILLVTPLAGWALDSGRVSGALSYRRAVWHTGHVSLHAHRPGGGETAGDRGNCRGLGIVRNVCAGLALSRERWLRGRGA